jgi:signal transduction histidine kinase
MSKPISEQDINNARHTLSLLKNQVSSERIETDYALRQIEKIGTLLERLEGLQKAQSASVRFEALYNVSRILGTSLEQETVLAQVMDAIIQLTKAERGFLMLRDDDGNLQVKIARNLDQQTLTSDEFKYSRTIANLVTDSGQGILTTNAVEDPRFAGGASILAQGLRSIMACPLRARGKIIGIAYVENRVIAGLFSQDDLTTLEALAGQASVAIDNALLFSETDEELSRRVEELRELRRIDLRLNEKLDPDQAMQFTLESACQLAKADMGYLGLVQGDPERVVSAYQHPTQPNAPKSTHYLDDAYPQVKEVLANGKSLSFSFEGRGFLIVPVKREQKVIAALILKREDGHISPDQQDLIERVVARAAVTIENARLYSAVQAADRAKSEFVGIVAHDLKAPMTSIQGYADLLVMQSINLDDRQKMFLDRISNTVKRMEMLVSDLADISRIESGHFYMDTLAVNVKSVVDAVRDQTTPQIQARKHTYIEEVDPTLPDMKTDFYRLVQVLTNLVSNAYKYTPDNGTITLRVQRHNQRVRFEVSDTGIGLSEEGIRMMGTKFWRAEDNYTRSQPGTGLGFAITASIIEQMGSRVEITSKLGEGSTFAFSVALMG